MVHYQVILAYDGTQFQGFQRQANARTVQGAIEDALRQLNWRGSSILAAGRTDTGVHATGQVIAFDLEWAHSPQNLQDALNACLPFDVAALEVSASHPGFHPRRDASVRCYRYSLYCQPVRNPLLARYAWQVWPTVELSLLHQAACILPGKHNFAAFGTPPLAGGSTFRTVLKAEWRQEMGLLVFEIAAHAFLYHMVRRLVFMQVMIGQGKLTLQDLQQALDHPMQNPALQSPLVHGLAPAHGLVLTQVEYTSSKPMDNQVTKQL
ncbi:MAG: tRNA pseudouridine(38-40) synthase TruA [Anaerolineales bacterium]|nr:tRNA pseudouridine(38-40) synthase TruA [Anaerolineales bacterium]